MIKPANIIQKVHAHVNRESEADQQELEMETEEHNILDMKRWRNILKRMKNTYYVCGTKLIPESKLKQRK